MPCFKKLVCHMASQHCDWIITSQRIVHPHFQLVFQCLALECQDLFLVQNKSCCCNSCCCLSALLGMPFFMSCFLFLLFITEFNKLFTPLFFISISISCKFTQILVISCLSKFSCHKCLGVIPKEYCQCIVT